MSRLRGTAAGAFCGTLLKHKTQHEAKIPSFLKQLQCGTSMESPVADLAA